MKVNHLERRILSFVLAVAIFVSNLALGAAAEETLYCGNENHAHTEECYVNHNISETEETELEVTEFEETEPEETEAEATEAEVTEPEITEIQITEPEVTEPEVTEPEVTEPEVTEPEVTEPEVTEPEITEPEVTEPEVTEPVCTCGSENEIHGQECQLYEPTFLEAILVLQTLKELHDAMMENVAEVMALTAEELTTLKARAEELFAAIEEPTQDERDYYTLIIETVEALLPSAEEEIAPPVDTLDESVSIVRNGSRLRTSGAENYQWQRLGDNGDYENIEGATEAYYDLTEADSNAYLRVQVGEGIYSSSIVVPGFVVIFDIAQGAVNFGSNYSGKAIDGTLISGAHQAGNIYIVQQSNEKMTTYSITFSGHHPNSPFEVTLRGVNMGANPTNHNQAPGSGGSNTPTTGHISIPATSGDVKKVTFYLQNENAVRNITYYNGGDTNKPATVYSSLKITDINGDGESNGGSLYIPKKIEANEIDAFVATNTNYNHWNAGIGGLDSTSLVQNLSIAGGKIQVVTTLGDNCTAIGAGGNGYCQMEISGGEVIAHCNGTGAAIGGGIGWQAAGGTSNVLISGGKIYAKNHSRITSGTEIVGGVAIGAGSSFHQAGSEGKVTITGGTVEAYGTFGNGIGGGNSSTSTGGPATINISGGVVKATSIGGGNSKRGAGGNADVTVSAPASVTLEKGIGGGLSESGDGGSSTIIVTGGILHAGGTIGGGDGGGTGDGGNASVNVSGGSLKAKAIGGGVGSIGGDGGAAIINISDGVIETGSIGGGNTLNTSNGKMGYATAEISGGDISGQFLLIAGGAEPCRFNMTGGTLHGVNTAETTKYQYAQANGAAVYMNDPNGVASMSGSAKITNCSAENGGAVYMTAGAFTMSGTAEISSCNASVNGGAVYLGSTGENKGSFTMTSGTIKANSATNGLGGAIYLAGGDATVSGGSIGAEGNPNTAKNGGGAFLAGGALEVSGAGSFAYNTATENGGGAYLDGGTLTMTGGSFTNNAATNNGGGAYIHGGDFNLNGDNATISENEAYQGAGIYLTGGKPNLLRGTMLNNEAFGNGGGIYIDQQQVTLAPTGDVKITGNKAIDGAGMYIAGTTEKKASFALADGSTGKVLFSGNEASGNGGGVCLAYGDMTITNDSIAMYGNKAANGGGAAVVNGSFNISGGSIGMIEKAQNDAENGGGIYVSGGNVSVTAAAAIENNKATNGGGVYLTGGEFTLSGANVSITQNEAANGGGVYLYKISPKLLEGSIRENTATVNGGGIYIDQQAVILAPEGTVQINENAAVDGAGIYIGGTTEKRASFVVNKESNGTVQLCNNTATGNGAGVCISNGEFTLDANNIALQNNEAENGGAVAVLSGNFTMSAGTIGGHGFSNEAQNGGAVYVNGGNVDISGGEISYNKAVVNGGGISVNDGDVIMSGGSVSNNEAQSGSGGGMFVASTSGEPVHATIYSGTIAYNTAAVSGGAVGIKGTAESNITVQIGVHEDHYDDAGNLTLGFTHGTNDEYKHDYCPKILNNQSSVSGGAFFITRTSSEVPTTAKTLLNIYCLEETGNDCSGDVDINNIKLSNFMMVEGGSVTVSTAANCNCDGTDHEHENSDDVHGHATINGSVHVSGGTLDLYGSMLNPAFKMPITIDLEKTEDHFHDHRTSPGYIKLSYYENFDFNDVVDSTRTAIDLKAGEPHTISDSLYKHEGYEIVGWNTQPDKSGKWYESGKTYVFVESQEEADKLEAGQLYHIGDLILYAIWEANGYTVKFDPGVDDDVPYTGEMEDQAFTYNVTDNLKPNAFKREGYYFEKWIYTDDNGEVKEKGDRAEVVNLTSVKGGEVTLYAQWLECTDHPTFRYTVTKESDQKAILSKICTRCGHEETATLMASNAVYDKTEHPATVVYSNEAAFTGLITNITYTGTKINSEESVQNPEKATNAGDYTATISIAGVEDTAATVQFTIEKAEQTAPALKPSYTEPETGNNILKVHPYNSSERDYNVSSESGLLVEFDARYYEKGSMKSAGWEQITKQDGKYQDVEIELSAELKYYFVYARYPGNDNYYPSAEIMADSTFLFEGNISLTFVVDEGLQYMLEDDSAGNLQVNVRPNSDFYLVGNKTTVVKTYDDQNVITVTKAENDIDFTITKTEGVSTDKAVNITITITEAKKKATITGKIQEKQIYEDLVGSANPIISSDSAYTVLYTVKNYNSAGYGKPQLKFDQELPVGTTVILQSKGLSRTTYWKYAVTQSDDDLIVLDEFTRMGSTAEDKFTAINGDMNLKFVVDFSGATNLLSGDLTTTLKIPATENGGAADCSIPLSVKLVGTQFSLSAAKISDLTSKLSYSFAPEDDEVENYPASKWDYRDLALVVTTRNLPIDAVLAAKVNGVWRNVRPYTTDKYIIPLGTALSGEVELSLQSSMLPNITKTYTVSCQLHASRSLADAAPLDNVSTGTTTVADEVSCAFTTTQKTVALSITGPEKPLFTSSNTVTVNVTKTIPSGYVLKVQLEHKDQNDVYVNTARKAEEKNGEYTFSLDGCVPDSYRIMAIIEREDGFVVAQDPYYFIIQ